MSFGGFWRSGCATRTADFAAHYSYLEKVAVRVAILESGLKEVAGRIGRKGTEWAAQIQQYFSAEELEGLIFELGLNPDEVPGDTMTTRPFHLVEMCERRGLSGELRRLLGEKRPFVDW